ncbi:DUF3562 domain-containing protein [Burkholderia stagnalis]|uniref:DUF3562 domain-containing protein n=1 Tax=Burkholderia stagnalis TaxID=1503054 RepID=UPI00075CB676|nr:DUF3562 domain-containing protein [Burkholderia stagnalis]KVO58340.1 hypothetical protein WT18_14210 [Burkholderia stagnalis]KVP10456.1 hypothetical protein WT20_16200 [Burkholderia stagnalis]KVW98085.1 hypothetical protein WT30_03980 [Burkholderia stagnalis]KWH80664.1 hypothetical protein WT66_00325 [Burkholderia stagnalis]KWK33035.1 hypothetical protein WT77_01620 [Burkholderia stagnalis]
MSRDNLLESLKEFAAQRAISEDQLRTMIDDEVRVLAADARVHDYVHVFAIRHLRDRMRKLDEQAAQAAQADHSRQADNAPPGHTSTEPTRHASQRL